MLPPLYQLFGLDKTKFYGDGVVTGSIIDG